MTANNHLNNEILKKQWDSTASSCRTGALRTMVLLLQRRLDLEMPSPTFMNRDTLLQLSTKAGSQWQPGRQGQKNSPQAIEFGFFDQPQTDTDIPSYSQQGGRSRSKPPGQHVLLKNQAICFRWMKQIEDHCCGGSGCYPAVITGAAALNQAFQCRQLSRRHQQSPGINAKVLYAVDTPLLTKSSRIPNLSRSRWRDRPEGEYFSNEELKARLLCSH